MTSHLKLTQRAVLFADGRNGSATQIHQVVEHPRVYVIAQRNSSREPFKETFVVGPADASGLDVLRKQNMTEYETLDAAIDSVVRGLCQ